MRIFIGICIAFILTGCITSSSNRRTIIYLDIRTGSNDTKAYLETIPYANEKKEILDSIKLIKGNKQSAYFPIPFTEERSYKIRFSNSRLEIILINDSPKITIHGNIYQPNNYFFENSPASSSIKAFIDKKLQSANNIRSYASELMNPDKKNQDKRLDS
ncbi:MAG: hypothetical protein ACJ748_01455, partial [Flavisolibacter sp.]